MNIRLRNVARFLMGGEMGMEDPGMAPEEAAPEAAAPAGPEAGGGQDPMAMLLQGAAQALQAQDCNIAMQVCQMLVQLAQGGAGGGAPAPEGQPVYRRGGILSRRIR